MIKRLAAAFVLVLTWAPLAGAAGVLRVAAAANLAFALGAIDSKFQGLNPGTHVEVSIGASGSLVSQIANGAPFDIFLSADSQYAQALAKTGKADPLRLTPFAVGRLVLWSVKAAVPVSDTAATVNSPLVRTLAIANPERAPYGRAARQALTKLGLWEAARPKIVTGDSVSQAVQFVSSGNADAGFVPLSAVLSPELKGRGVWSEVPAGLHEPLVQVAAITRKGESNPDSAAYIAFLVGPQGRQVFAQLGYGAP